MWRHADHLLLEGIIAKALSSIQPNHQTYNVDLKIQCIKTRTSWALLRAWRSKVCRTLKTRLRPRRKKCRLRRGIGTREHYFPNRPQTTSRLRPTNERKLRSPTQGNWICRVLWRKLQISMLERRRWLLLIVSTSILLKPMSWCRSWAIKMVNLK